MDTSSFNQYNSGMNSFFNIESPLLLPQYQQFNFNNIQFEMQDLSYVPSNSVQVFNLPVLDQNVIFQDAVVMANVVQPEVDKKAPLIVQSNADQLSASHVNQGESNEESTKEPISSQIEEDSEFKDKQHNERSKVLLKKTIKKQKVESPKNYDKNICRYLTRCSIRSFLNEKYQKNVMNLCHQNEELYDELVNFFTKFMEQITGFRVLKQFLIIEDNDNQKMQLYKTIFKKFLEFFLKERIIRYIMKGKMDNKQAYIKYKNEVMLKFLNKPEKWMSNKNKNQNLNQIPF